MPAGATSPSRLAPSSVSASIESSAGERVEQPLREPSAVELAAFEPLDVALELGLAARDAERRAQAAGELARGQAGAGAQPCQQRGQRRGRHAAVVPVASARIACSVSSS